MFLCCLGATPEFKVGETLFSYHIQLLVQFSLSVFFKKKSTPLLLPLDPSNSSVINSGPFALTQKIHFWIHFLSFLTIDKSTQNSKSCFFPQSGLYTLYCNIPLICFFENILMQLNDLFLQVTGLWGCVLNKPSLIRAFILSVS